jgi:hypothetical protein
MAGPHSADKTKAVYKMSSQYYRNLEDFGLKEFKERLASEELLPGRRMLKEDLEERFTVVQASGIDSLQQLIDALRTKNRVAAFAEESGLPYDYLVVLGRQARSYVPKPVYFREIPGLEPDHVARLEASGIKHTKHLFDRALTPAGRLALSQETRIASSDIQEYVRMSDLARILGVGPVFVRLYHEAGVRSLEDLAGRSPEELWTELHDVNDARGLSSIVPSLKDVRYSIGEAQELPHVAEYE